MSGSDRKDVRRLLRDLYHEDPEAGKVFRYRYQLSTVLIIIWSFLAGAGIIKPLWEQAAKRDPPWALWVAAGILVLLFFALLDGAFSFAAGNSRRQCLGWGFVPLLGLLLAVSLWSLEAVTCKSSLAFSALAFAFAALAAGLNCARLKGPPRKVVPWTLVLAGLGLGVVCLTSLLTVPPDFPGAAAVDLLAALSALAGAAAALVLAGRALANDDCAGVLLFLAVFLPLGVFGFLLAFGERGPLAAWMQERVGAWALMVGLASALPFVALLYAGRSRHLRLTLKILGFQLCLAVGLGTPVWTALSASGGSLVAGTCLFAVTWFLAFAGIISVIDLAEEERWPEAVLCGTLVFLVVISGVLVSLGHFRGDPTVTIPPPPAALGGPRA